MVPWYSPLFFTVRGPTRVQARAAAVRGAALRFARSIVQACVVSSFPPSELSTLLKCFYPMTLSHLNSPTL